ncbi:MAG: acetyl-CoA carboxylase biotin carboxyl carrier protein [Planctomycetes bacterium]|nr:acetyl-CoA carboxylase biotin carboxyl carrier protein [Planctomycetota bacterium]
MGFILQPPGEPGKESVNLERLKELIALMERHALVELEIEEEGGRVRLRKGGEPVVEKQVVTIPASAPVLETAAPSGGGARPAAPDRPGLVEIHSPMVGTFFRAPSPDADPYVQQGDRIEEGTVLCLIEAMKVMNEVKSEISGVIREIPVENGEAVEYGQAIFAVEPV